MKEKNPFKIIAYAVCLGHVLFMLILLFASPRLFEKKRQQPLLVKTVVSATALSEKKAAPIATAPQRPKPQLPAPKPTEKKIVQKKEVPPKAVKQSKAPLISDDLLKQLEEGIAKMSDTNKPASHKRAHTTATAPSKLQIDMPSRSNGNEDKEYVTLLTQCLHSSLHLPDFGEVKIELTLRQDGTVAKLIVLKAESEKNRKYLEATLVHLQFPVLKGSYAKHKECAFTLNFCNEL